MNDLRWGSLAAKHQKEMDESNSDGAESWGWFVDALDLNRIRSTLSNFPVADTLEPAPCDEVECRNDLYNEVKQDRQPKSSPDSEDETENRSCISESAGSSTHQSMPNIKNGLWERSGDDTCYSPAFILPLILATLEARLPRDQSNSSECPDNAQEMNSDEEIGNNNEAEIDQRKTFGSICRRVCDKGGIALVIASLASRCPSVRKVAVSICGLFLKALQMPESHEMKSWRERPQLEMVLSSIQRGLTVRRAIQIQRLEDQGIELGGEMPNTCKYNVPMLPSVSAIFLAKALMIESKPRDDMYGQMNRYFLRLTDYHGAFQDCFGLPAFLSLYCSSADTQSRCSTERHWALLTLKDSAVDEFCFRIISQHHVPELIMSSFDSLVDDRERKSEVCFTIDVIDKLIQSGGTRASTHLIKRQGLLSWLHGIISWREVSTIFPDDALKCRFLKLITTAVDAYRSSKDLSDDTLEFYEKLPLANAVIRIALECSDPADMNRIEVGSFQASPTTLAMTCNALWAIYLADKESQITSTDQGLTSLHDTTVLLTKFVRHREMFGKVLVSVCDLPVTNDIDLRSAKLFCELALAFALDMGTQIAPDTGLLSLKRVQQLMQLHPLFADDTNIRSKVMKCRHLAVTITGGIDVWDRFLPYVLGRQHLGSDPKRV